MTTNSDLKSTLKSLADNLANGNKSASEVAGSLNLWLKEGGEALRVKIEDEVERSVSKLGFIKRGEFEALKQQVAELANSGVNRTESIKEGRNPKNRAKQKTYSDPGEESDKKSSKKSSKKSGKKSSKNSAKGLDKKSGTKSNHQKNSKLTESKKAK
jgi:hypothetical protein